MKKTMMVVMMLVGGLILAKPAMANEGVFRLKPVEGETGNCFATSIYIDGSYRILMTCRDLRMAVDPEQNKYVAWTETGTKKRRIGEVLNGKFMGRNEEKFDRILVSLEKDATASKLEGKLVLSGTVEPIDFGKGASVTTVSVTAQPTVSPTKVIDTKTTTTKTSTSGLGSVLGTVVKIALLGFGLLILVVGAFGFMSRRKKL